MNLNVFLTNLETEADETKKSYQKIEVKWCNPQFGI